MNTEKMEKFSDIYDQVFKSSGIKQMTKSALDQVLVTAYAKLHS